MAVGFAFAGWSIFRAAGNILKFLAATRAARTPQDIDAAAQLFARACAQLSIATLITILTRGAAKIAARPGFRQRQGETAKSREIDGAGQRSVVNRLRSQKEIQFNNSEKLRKQMKKRGWTYREIREAMTTDGIPATGKNGAATRFVHPLTGRSVVIDNKTGEVFHLGGDGFKYDY